MRPPKYEIRIPQAIKLRELLAKDPGHDPSRHGGKAFTRTGYVSRCKRCILLRRIERIEGGLP